MAGFVKFKTGDSYAERDKVYKNPLDWPSVTG